MVIVYGADPHGIKWLKIKEKGDKVISVLTLIAYTVCLLWILGIAP